MTALSSMVFVLMLLSLFLLGVLTLRLARTSRQQRSSIEELNEALRRTREYAEQQKSKLAMRSDLDTVKDEFISTVSHELRTPLTSIRGALGLLSAGLLGNVDPKAQNLLRIASSNTERLIRLINDILDLERMESGRAPLKLRRCSMYDLAHEAVDTMTAMADGAGIRLELTSFAPRDSIYFDADSDRILQVLTNLLSNAIKFSPTGSAVAVQIDSNPNSLLVKVVDQGRGIPADKLEAVFDRFQQVESSDSSKKGGTGLGLAICRSIIQQHGGAIWAQPNQTGQGTTLWVQLSRSARASDSASPGVIEPPAERGDGLILVCDDDPGIREVVAEQLRQHGYEILEAGSGEEVIALTRKRAAQIAQNGNGARNGVSVRPISAILLDLYMPGLSGWETLEQLREFGPTASIPVVILSVIPPTDRPPQAGNAQGWVQKPFNENLLLAELGRVLRVKGQSGHLLLVEQDEAMARAILEGFGDSGVRIDHAATLQQAVDRCLLGPPDLLILDLTLPDGDGFSLVDWLRRQPGLQALPLVVYSGREVSEAEMAKLRLGPTQFLNKANVQPQEVEAVVLTMVQRLRNPAAAPVA
ncbi:MAG TPA: ATP-binding protein [Acidobacteriaceae bacterium]|jgi:signal transduction histidine kinase/DNA-binding response OmpR family regulator